MLWCDLWFTIDRAFFEYAWDLYMACGGPPDLPPAPPGDVPPFP